MIDTQQYECFFVKKNKIEDQKVNNVNAYARSTMPWQGTQPIPTEERWPWLCLQEGLEVKQEKSEKTREVGVYTIPEIKLDMWDPTYENDWVRKCVEKWATN